MTLGQVFRLTGIGFGRRWLIPGEVRQVISAVKRQGAGGRVPFVQVLRRLLVDDISAAPKTDGLGCSQVEAQVSLTGV